MSNILDKITLSGVTYDLQDTAAQNGLTALAQSFDEVVSAKADTTAVTQEISAAVSGKADSSALTAYFDAAEYDSNSKHINFYNGGTGGTLLAYVDATDFIKDGMVSNVEIKTISGASYLAITFNADAGKEEIDIPISDIFDASNYYTKAEVDAALSGKVNTNTFTSFTASTDTALSGKQDTLVSGTNIKTINNISLLGDGNITVQGGTLPTVSGTTLIFA